jgi:hypothetical protein
MAVKHSIPWMITRGRLVEEFRCGMIGQLKTVNEECGRFLERNDQYMYFYKYVYTCSARLLSVLPSLIGIVVYVPNAETAEA